MMKARKPLISATRLASFRWRVLMCIAQWLPWLLKRDTLNEVARMAGLMVFLNLAARIAPPPLSSHRHGVKKERGAQRAIIGSRLRKAMRGRDNATRIGAILTVLRHPERWVAHLMRRLRKGLTRRRLVRVFRNDACPPACAGGLAPAALNSS
jgi:hypothetical protein